MAKVTFANYEPAQIRLKGQQVVIEVKRMNLEEFLPWEEQYNEFGRPAGDTTPEQDKARAAALLAWLRESMAAYVRVPIGEINGPDGGAVTTGEELHRLLGPQIDRQIDVMNQIWACNRLDEEVRGKLLSPSGSATTSDARPLAAVGPKPEQIAAPAALPASAPIEGVNPPAA